jgi:hypothetical protein
LAPPLLMPRRLLPRRLHHIAFMLHARILFFR